jgi:acyl-CoA thioester hydrolase
MARIKIDLPGHFPFSTLIPLRITDLNYGGHVGNDNILSIIHEARVRFLAHYGYQEMAIGGLGLIMSEALIEFKRELFYGDALHAFVAPGEFTRVGFELYYRLETEESGKVAIVAIAKTGMVCYDYARKKMASLPGQVKTKLLA